MALIQQLLVKATRPETRRCTAWGPVCRAIHCSSQWKLLPQGTWRTSPRHSQKRAGRHRPVAGVSTGQPLLPAARRLGRTKGVLDMAVIRKPAALRWWQVSWSWARASLGPSAFFFTGSTYCCSFSRPCAAQAGAAVRAPRAVPAQAPRSARVVRAGCTSGSAATLANVAAPPHGAAQPRRTSGGPVPNVEAVVVPRALELLHEGTLRHDAQPELLHRQRQVRVQQVQLIGLRLLQHSWPAGHLGPGARGPRVLRGDALRAGCSCPCLRCARCRWSSLQWCGFYARRPGEARPVRHWLGLRSAAQAV